MMEHTTHEPRKIPYSIKRMEALLDTALEHASHGWHALEQETKVNRLNPESWPPGVKAEVGSAQYHLAAMISYIFEAYESISGEVDHIEQVDSLIEKVLSEKRSGKSL